MQKRIFQTAFVVRDVQETARAFYELCGIGPWFVIEHYPLKSLCYHGAPTTMDFSLAVAFTGSMMIELLQQNDAQPSAYQDLIENGRYGFHHLALPSFDYEQDLARMRALGFDIPNECTSPDVHGGGRAAYVDTRGRLPGMIELAEMVPQLQTALQELQAIAGNWDGTDPVRIMTAG